MPQLAPIEEIFTLFTLVFIVVTKLLKIQDSLVVLLLILRVVIESEE